MRDLIQELWDTAATEAIVTPKGVSGVPDDVMREFEDKFRAWALDCIGPDEKYIIPPLNVQLLPDKRRAHRNELRAEQRKRVMG